MSSGTSSQTSPSPQSQVSAWCRSAAIECASACCSAREMPVDLAVGPEVAAHRRRQQPLLEAAHRRRRDQLVEGRVTARAARRAVGLHAGRARAPVPEPRRLALELDLVGVAQLRILERRRGDLVASKRAGRSRAARRAAAPRAACRAPRRARPRRRRRDRRDGSALERCAHVPLERAAPFDDLALRAELVARHALRLTAQASSISARVSRRRARCRRRRRCRAPAPAREAPTIAEATFSLAQHPRERELGHRDPEALRDRDEPLDALEHVVRRASSPIIRPIRALVAREPSGGGSPGRYFPVSAPCASGDQTICEMPFAAQSGITSLSGLAPEQRVLRLRGDELRAAVLAAQVERRLDLRRGPLAEADVARLAGPDDLGRAPPSSPRAASARRSGGTGRGRRGRCAGARSDASICFSTCARESPWFSPVSSIGK